ncbi:MAG: 50S ribosomal protein L32 [Elusimicrobia bacterium]|jgi:large subunit ribosomal protein L32|nr:50S ribosomal protein L32 [Elusimicrobiota bacterium]
MAVPKRRQSNSRRDKRRHSKKIKDPTLSVCPHCQAVRLPHHLCMECGYYGDKNILGKAGEQEKK